MAKRIKSLTQIRREITAQKLKIARAKIRDKLEQERSDAAMELKVLTRSTSTNRNIILAQRTKRGFIKISKAGLKLVKRQAKRIKEQQLRDDAIERRINKQRRKVVKTGKKVRRSVKKIRKDLPSNIFSNLDF